MLKGLLEALAGLFIARVGLLLVGEHPVGGILTLVSGGFLILEGVSRLL